MGDEPIRRAFGLDLLRRLPERERFALCEDVCQEDLMVAAKRIERLAKGDEVTRNKPGPLVNQLVEGVLTVGSRLAPIDGAGRIRDLGPVNRDVLAVALHR